MVLLIDDNDINHFISSRMITKAVAPLKINFISYSSGTDAIEYLLDCQFSDSENFPDYLFLDINMPVMNGWEFLDKLIKFKLDSISGMNIYILTSSLFTQDVLKSKSYSNVSGFISKPLTIERLASIFNS
jgi:CheY-like chemotaxis protein